MADWSSSLDFGGQAVVRSRGGGCHDFVSQSGSVRVRVRASIKIVLLPFEVVVVVEAVVLIAQSRPEEPSNIPS